MLNYLDSTYQLSLPDFVWSDCKDEIPRSNIDFLSLYGFDTKDGKSESLFNDQSLNPLFSNNFVRDQWNSKSISHLIHSYDVGLAVFYCFMNIPIPLSFFNKLAKQQDDLRTHTQLLAFFQRLLTDNGSISRKTFFETNKEFGLTPLNRKLRLLPPDLQL